MDLAPYVAAIEDSLEAAAAAGDEGTRRTAAALTAALEPAIRLAIMNALADLAVEVTDALGDRLVELRLEGGDVRIVSQAAVPEEEVPDGSTDAAGASGEPTRITLRLPESLKAHAERAAAVEGVSLNTWLTRAVQQSLGRQRSRRVSNAPGHRLRGWVQG